MLKKKLYLYQVLWILFTGESVKGIRAWWIKLYVDNFYIQFTTLTIFHNIFWDITSLKCMSTIWNFTCLQRQTHGASCFIMYFSCLLIFVLTLLFLQEKHLIKKFIISFVHHVAFFFLISRKGPEEFGADLSLLLDATTLELLWSMTVAAFVLFGMIGAFISAKVADFFGRKRGMIIITLLMFLAAVLGGITLMASSPECLILSRSVSHILTSLTTCC